MYILVFVFASNIFGVVAIHQEFSSLDTCQLALKDMNSKLIAKGDEKGLMMATCYKK